MGSDFFSSLSQIFRIALPFLPDNVLTIVELVSVVLAMLIAVWGATTDAIAQYIPWLVSNSRYKFIDNLADELDKVLGHLPKADLSNPKVVRDLIMSKDASEKI